MRRCNNTVIASLFRSLERRKIGGGSPGHEKKASDGDPGGRGVRYPRMTRSDGVGGVVLVGLMLGYANTPGAWYAALTKPAFNPPNYLFAPVWLALYVCIGVAGAKTWLCTPRSPAAAAWGTQMVLNFLWSPVFFGMHSIGLALGIVLAMLMSIAAFIGLQWRSDRLAALLFVPYGARVTFATALNWSIFWLN